MLATRNPHKLREFERLLEPSGIAVVPLPDGVELPPEDGDDVRGQRAAEGARPRPRAGRPAIADDSGIEAAALGGGPACARPGTRARRRPTQENLAKLMREAPAGSGLRYVCALAYVDPETGEERVFFGDCRGRLAAQPTGQRRVRLRPGVRAGRDGGDRTMAELPDAEKDAISHRGHAVRALSSGSAAEGPCMSAAEWRTVGPRRG